MAIELAIQYQSYTDELFATESTKSLLTNQDFTWDGAHTIKIYRVSTSEMHDYGRAGPAPKQWSRYGPVAGLDATTQAMTLRKDRSFTFAIDKLDTDETRQQLAAASALARQLREVVVPEVDTYVYNEMCANAGTVADPVTLDGATLYQAIITGTEAMDDAEVPEQGRYIVATPRVYRIMKTATDMTMETDITNDMRIRGVIAMVDGMPIVRVPANRLPADFGFLLVHPVATVAPVKLEDYEIHENPPGISGSLVEGRINYDAFVLDNKAKALYYQPQTVEE